MAASPKKRRTGRYTRGSGPEKSITPLLLTLMAYVGDFEVLSTPLLARLAEVSPKAVRRLMRIAFDQGLVSLVAVPRALLADPTGSNAASLAYGSSPNLYILSATGQKLLHELGRLERIRPTKRYGPQNSLFLAHALLTKRVRIWLTLASRQGENEFLTQWREGEEAVITLSTPGAPKPDAWFTYRVAESTLVAFVEADRGTERGRYGRWADKIIQYEALFTSGRLKEVTGYRNARLLVICLGIERRNRLASFIHTHASPALADRVWLAEQGVLSELTLFSRHWQRPGHSELFPLLAFTPPDASKQ